LRAPHSVWGDLVSSACDLHPDELFPRIVRAFEQGLVDEVMVTMEDVHDAARDSREEALAKTRRSRHHTLVTDTVREMESWACFQEPSAELEDDWEEPALNWTGSASDEDLQPIRRTQPKVGRNAPCPCGSGKKFKKCCGR
jgi:preprotein translocase subunit SecA